MNSAALKTIFSSDSVDWSTPNDLFDRLDEKYSFTLDPCASETNSKCDEYFTIEDDGLVQDWSGHTVFMNPPYGRIISKWVKKAFEESKKLDTKVVCLLPARTDTQWWHKYCMKADEIYFIKGRLKFGDSINAAPFPSAVVVFTDEIKPKLYMMQNKNTL